MRKDFTIGLVVPFATDAVPEEGLQMYPGVRFVARGVGVRSLTPRGYDSAWEGILPAAKHLAGLGVGIRLVDFKMETGRLWENDLMRIVVADELSPDSCRLWDIKSNEKLDKDRFRRDLGGLVEAYAEVAKRLGIMSEGERPHGTGPVLVKG